MAQTPGDRRDEHLETHGLNSCDPKNTPRHLVFVDSSDRIIQWMPLITLTPLQSANRH